MTGAAVSRDAREDILPGDVDLSDPKTFLAGVPNEYFRVLRKHAMLLGHLGAVLLRHAFFFQTLARLVLLGLLRLCAHKR